MRNAPHVVVECTEALAANNDLLFEPLVKVFETSYLSTRALNQGSLLLLHDVHSCKSLVNRYNLL